MTNFQGAEPSQRRWVTPERAVLVLPVLGGAVLAVLVVMAGLSPLLVQVQQRSGQVQEMQRKQAELPQLKRRLDALLGRQREAQGQRELLLQLVAGTAPLNTWLTQVNRLAARQGLAILSVEPQPLERPRPAAAPTPAAGSATTAPNQPPPPPADPLLAGGVEKHSVLLILQGPYPRLLAFLQQLELLQVIVTASDLELEQVPATASSTPNTSSTSNAPPLGTPPPPETKLKLKLSAYGRGSEAAF